MTCYAKASRLNITKTPLMSGLEVPGLVFGVLPLLISAAVHYEDVFKPFRRFKNFTTELDLYRIRLEVQKTIFLNQCQLLLAGLVGKGSAKAMISEKGHPYWKDDTMNRKLVERLGKSKESCQATIEMISQKLKIIEEDAESFGSTIQYSLPTFADQAWRSRVRKKLNFSFSESRLKEYLDDLRKLNLDFRTLAKQTTTLGCQQQEASLSSKVAIYPTKKVEECRLVQRTSVQLYEAMRIACEHHAEHSAQFQLLPQNIEPGDLGHPFVHFNMAFTHRGAGKSVMVDPIWIEVKSSFIEAASRDYCSNTDKPAESSRLLRTLTHKLDSSEIQCAKKQRVEKCVRFAEPSSIAKEKDNHNQKFPTNEVKIDLSGVDKVSPSALSINNSGQDTSLPDFCIQHDFCLQLRKFCTYSRSPENKHIGYFQKDGPCKHLISFAAPVSVHGYTEPISLFSVIETMSNRLEKDQYLQCDILRLAARLASAVLQFHATPLLQGFWQSDDVIFFGNDNRPAHTTDTDSISIASPHLNVKVSSPKSAVLLEERSQNLESATKHVIRNPYLFSLGVTLIELAFQAPLRSLYKSEDLTDGQPNIMSDISAANRLSQTISSSLGIPYGKVVRKCLACDFGQDVSDLKDAKLQAVFYQDVVCELERLERGFSMLQLGD
ncbi:hypothetical protein PVAG01_10307 [Phlyctema vagabunda]|uniref:DUF7580 domain-containing protein n=1 Tax=Phlyctema vagabunda TaxID=108571 RepID=A0ABR4P5K1_9HELO